MHHKTDMGWFMRECAKADTLAQLASLAIAELHKFPHGGEFVCGPINTGGRGSIEKNLEVFEATIQHLKRQGVQIFNQMPYEERIFFFRERWQKKDPSRAGQYYTPVLEEFYLPIIQTGLITRGWFIPGWQSSIGARWEREQLRKNGAEIFDLHESSINEALDAV